MADDLMRASGLWLKDGKRGKFMSGKIDDAIPAGAKLLVFRNTFKKTDDDADYTLFFVNPLEQPPMNRAEPGDKSPPRADDPDGIPF